MTILEYEDLLSKCPQGDSRVVYLPGDVYSVFKHLCTYKEKMCIPSAGLQCLRIGEFLLFECDDAVFNTDTPFFRELRELEQKKLDADKTLLEVMRKAIS